MTSAGQDQTADRVVKTPDDRDGVGQFAAGDWLLFVSVSLIWGASFLLIAESLEGLTPGMVTLGRVGSGALTLVVLRLIIGPPSNPIARQDRLRVLLVSVLWVALPFTLFPLAQERINSALTGLLNGAVPIFVALIATVVTGSRPRGNLLLGLIVGFTGVVTLSLPSLGQGSSQAGGVLMVLGATVCYGIAFNVAAPLQQRYGGVTLMTPIMVLATVMLALPGLRNFGDNNFSAEFVLPVLLLGVLGTGVAYWIVSTLVGSVGPIPASFITYLIPVVSLILGVVVRGDRVATLSLFGAGLTTLGALLASGRITLGRLGSTPG